MENKKHQLFNMEGTSINLKAEEFEAMITLLKLVRRVIGKMSEKEEVSGDSERADALLDALDKL